jgi:hypothetical protein
LLIQNVTHGLHQWLAQACSFRLLAEINHLNRRSRFGGWGLMKNATLAFDLFDCLDRGMGGTQNKQRLFALHPDPGYITGMIARFLRFFKRGIFFVIHP